MTRRKKKPKGTCVFCGKPATTKDHIPPRKIYVQTEPDDLITVPACRSCNNGTKLDDEYFRLCVMTGGSNNAEVEQHIFDKLMPSLRRNPKLLAMFMKGARTVDITTPSGIVIGQRHAFDFDRKRLQRIVEKIVKGLYWRNKGKRLGDECYVRDFVLTNQGDFGLPAFDFKSAKWEEVAGGDFRYQFIQVPQDDCLTGWSLEFYRGVIVMTVMTDRLPGTGPTLDDVLGEGA